MLSSNVLSHLSQIYSLHFDVDEKRNLKQHAYVGVLNVSDQLTNSIKKHAQSVFNI